MPYDIPDFRREEDRVKWENDHISPFPNERGEADIPCSSIPHTPTEEDLAHARAYWEMDVKTGKW